MFCIGAGAAFGQSLFERGQDLFMQNSPEQAVAMLQSALQQEPTNDKIYLYLGICYDQLGQRDKAISIMGRGLSVPGADVKLLYYNMGNDYFLLKQYDKAADMYAKAISADSTFAPAYLNSANVIVQANQADKFPDAVQDYTVYLNLRPNDPQKDRINQMIALLTKDVADAQAKAEAAAQAAADAKAKAIAEAEQKQKEDEAQKAAEEAKRKALLDQVMSSLDNTGSATTNLSGGDAQIQKKTEPLDIAE